MLTFANRTASALAAALLMITAATPIATADERPPLRLLTLNGEGSVKATPDMAIIRVGVVRVAENARDALSANNEAMAQVLASLKAAGIEDKDLQTSGFSIQPRYHYDKSNRREPRIIGYQVSNQITAAVRNLTTLGDTLDRVVSLGSNQINGITFTIADPEPLKNEARRRATANALAKAKLYAEAAGIALGPIQQISESGGYRPPQPVLARAEASFSARKSSVPTAAGEHEVTMQVHISWEIK